MALQSISPQGTVVSASLMDNFDIDIMSAIQMAVLAIVTLILGLFVIKPLLSREPLPDASGVPALPPASRPEGLNGEVASDDFELPDLPMISGFGNGMDELPDLKMAGGASGDPVERLRSMIGERQDETVEILRSWLEDKEENV
jgi:flagellar M-ring protein FliF